MTFAKMPIAPALVLPLFLLATGVAGEESEKTEATKKVEDAPQIEGFDQLLPRGAIAALVDPEFVSAEEAEMPDDAWILGFAHGGEAYAYDLNLLNSHEVVNHRIAGEGYAAVW